MRESRQRALGLTLIELLIAMAIIGILVSAIIALSAGFLGYSRRVSAVNERLIDINDAVGYIALNGRRAMLAIGGATTVDISAGGTTFTCANNAASGPCLALVVPIVDRNSTAADIVGFELLAYRIVPMSAWNDNPGLPAGWDGANTPLLLEYRAPLCLGCSSPPALPSSVTADQVSLVISDLFLEDNAGNPITPFTVQSAQVELIIALRTRAPGSQDQVIVPADGPLVMTVTRRP
jgi:prepilin-type N-terminal cleavage/methylation domain-containing protein